MGGEGKEDLLVIELQTRPTARGTWQRLGARLAGPSNFRVRTRTRTSEKEAPTDGRADGSTRLSSMRTLMLLDLLVGLVVVTQSSHVSCRELLGRR
eukprot:767864-Hanusia_phi.AAC.3